MSLLQVQLVICGATMHAVQSVSMHARHEYWYILLRAKPHSNHPKHSDEISWIQWAVSFITHFFPLLKADFSDIRFD